MQTLDLTKTMVLLNLGLESFYDSGFKVLFSSNKSYWKSYKKKFDSKSLLKSADPLIAEIIFIKLRCQKLCPFVYI